MRYRRFPNQAKVTDSRFCIGARGVECVHVHVSMSMSMSMLCNMCTLQYTLPQGTKGQNETRETRERAAWLRGCRTAARCTHGWGAPAEISQRGIPTTYGCAMMAALTNSDRVPIFSPFSSRCICHMPSGRDSSTRVDLIAWGAPRATPHIASHHVPQALGTIVSRLSPPDVLPQAALMAASFPGRAAHSRHCAPCMLLRPHTGKPSVATRPSRGQPRC